MTDPLPVAFIGVEAFNQLDLSFLLLAIQRRTGSEVTLADSAMPSGPVTISVALDGLNYLILGVGEPVPTTDLSTAVQAAYGWRDAREAVRRSGAHWIVGTVQPSGGAPATDAMRTVTLITAALLEVVDALFVYWSAGDVLSSPPTFRKAADLLLESNRLPLLSWVQFRLLPGSAIGLPGRLGVRTTGLAQFHKPELKIDPTFPSPAEALSAGLDLASYIAAGTDIVLGGETVELSPYGVFEAEVKADEAGQSMLLFQLLARKAA